MEGNLLSLLGLLIFVVLLVVMIGWYNKRRFFTKRNYSKKIQGSIIEWKYEYVDLENPIRADYQKKYFPYVLIKDAEANDFFVRVEYGKPFKKFKIGYKINVFWDDGKLYYWDSYAKGIAKYLPPYDSNT